MKILCAYSSIEFTCEHFPGSLTSRESFHPIFHLPQRKLLPYLSKWSSRQLTPIDSYLLFLALLKSSNLIQFRVPAIRTEQTDRIVALNLEPLSKILIKLNTITRVESIFPHYVISPETKDLSNVPFWISNWNDSYQSYISGQNKFHKDREDWKKLQNREHALERLIKNPHKPVSSYSSELSDWASIAGDFPTYMVISPFNTAIKISCADYWKQIISKCTRAESIFSVPTVDLEDLLEHCELNIPIGTIYSTLLFKVLREALKKKKNFLGLGDQDISKSTYSILSSSDSVESANIQAIINSAPDHMPKPEEYPNKLAYLKAKMRYEMAQKSQKD